MDVGVNFSTQMDSRRWITGNEMEEDGIEDLLRNWPPQDHKTKCKIGSICNCEAALSSLKGFGDQERSPMPGERQTLHQGLRRAWKNQNYYLVHLTLIPWRSNWASFPKRHMKEIRNWLDLPIWSSFMTTPTNYRRTVDICFSFSQALVVSHSTIVSKAGCYGLHMCTTRYVKNWLES